MKIAVLLPCYNEEAAIAGVVRAFQAALPQAAVYVYDNNSRDRTAEVARAAGAIVRHERLQGKGNVVRRMFADVDADVYVMADGDGTYDPAAAADLIRLVRDEHLDMACAARVETAAAHGDAYRPGHRLGNRLFNAITAMLFDSRFEDIFTGYRAFSRRFVKSFPALTTGFDVETELVVHSLELALPVAEIRAPYGARVEGSASKLRTFVDGFRILRRIAVLLRHVRPLLFFSFCAAVLALLALALMYPVFLEYLQTGLVRRFPTAILSTGIMLCAALSLTCGLVLDSVAYARREAKRLAYLQQSAAVELAARSGA